MQAPAQFSRVFWFLSHTCPLVQTKDFIDLAIVDPNRAGTYLLGIECDGATYHSSKAARDRDRYRQEVLEKLGWKLYRIWSTDWFKNPDEEIEKLLASIKLLQISK